MQISKLSKCCKIWGFHGSDYEDVTLCGSCKNWHFGKTTPSIIRVKRICQLGTTLQVTSNWKTASVASTANTVPSLLILFILMMEAIRSSKMSVFTRATWYHIPEDDILSQCYPSVSQSPAILEAQIKCQSKENMFVCVCVWGGDYY
jgi:hypothetical protein